ncbi:MAG: hypothetical protein JO287_16305 [Pseudonocardiales bacterium]|nr:hypothetical protein [Pseudonocardiales bacterium]
MTTTPATGVIFVQAATMLAIHLADHALPEPASLRVNTSGLHSDVMAQLRSTAVPTVARDLLAWADTVPTVTVQAWRVLAGDRVHLSIASTLTGPTGAVELDVFGAVDYDPARFADLTAGDRCKVPLRQLRAWAALDVAGGRR